MGLKEMNTGDKMILWGNFLGSIAAALVSIGAALRARELPDHPLFSVPNEAGMSSGRVNNQQPNYWER